MQSSLLIKEVEFTIYQQILKEKERLEAQIHSIQAQLNHYPEGSIFCSKNNKYSKWYHTLHGKQFYIPKKNHQLAEQLTAKKYLTYLLDDLTQELKAIEHYLRYHTSSKAEHMLLEMPEYHDLLAPFFSPLSHELIEWTHAPYDRNTKYPEQLRFKSVSGNIVRSKSEALIDMLLYTHQIPYRYECPLSFGDITLYPDFTLRHPSSGKLYYWEHFGLMDKPDYCRSSFNKLHLYSSHGILPSIHLITTYESLSDPLTPDTIENIIQFYFS